MSLVAQFPISAFFPALLFVCHLYASLLVKADDVDSSPSGSISLSSWFSSTATTSPPTSTLLKSTTGQQRLAWLSSEATGEGLLFFVRDNGDIYSCEDDESIIEHVLKLYTEKRFSDFTGANNNKPPNTTAGRELRAESLTNSSKESIADETIKKKQVEETLKLYQQNFVNSYGSETPSGLLSASENNGGMVDLKDEQPPLETETIAETEQTKQHPPNSHTSNEAGFPSSSGDDPILISARPEPTTERQPLPSPPPTSIPSTISEFSRPKRRLGESGFFSASDGLPQISSYHYMSPQQARTGWSNAVAVYGLNGMGTGDTVSLVDALGQVQTNVPKREAYAKAITANPPSEQRGKATEPKLSGLQLADREYSRQLKERVFSNGDVKAGSVGDLLTGILSDFANGGPMSSLVSSIAPVFGLSSESTKALSSLFSGIAGSVVGAAVQQSNPPTGGILDGLFTSLSNGNLGASSSKDKHTEGVLSGIRPHATFEGEQTRQLPRISRYPSQTEQIGRDVGSFTARRNLVDIFPHDTKKESVGSGEETMFGNNVEENPLGTVVSLLGSVAQAALPSVLHLAEPMFSQIGRQVARQAGPIGNEILKSLRIQALESLEREDPVIGKLLDYGVQSLTSSLAPLIESTIRREIDSQLLPMLSESIHLELVHAMSAHFQPVVEAIGKVISQELPLYLQNPMDVSINKAVKFSVEGALQENMPRYLRGFARAAANFIQTEKMIFGDIRQADTVQGLSKEMSGSSKDKEILLRRREGVAVSDRAPQPRQPIAFLSSLGGRDFRRSEEVKMSGGDKQEADNKTGAAKQRIYTRNHSFEVMEDDKNDEEQHISLKHNLVGHRPVVTTEDNKQSLLRGPLTNLGRRDQLPGTNSQQTTNAVHLVDNSSDTKRVDLPAATKQAWEKLVGLSRERPVIDLNKFVKEPQSILPRIGSSSTVVLQSPTKLSAYNQAMIDRHNDFRRQAGLREVQWDDTLAFYILSYIQSQDQHNSCTMEHSKQSQRERVGRFNNIGENLYTSWGGSTFPTARRIVEAWYNEVYCYRYGPVGAACTKYPNSQCDSIAGFKGKTPMTGHFTQIMWSTVTHVGCAAIKCSSYRGEGDKFFAGCSYASNLTGYGGNMVGVFPFDKATASKIGLPIGLCK